MLLLSTLQRFSIGFLTILGCRRLAGLSSQSVAAFSTISHRRNGRASLKMFDPSGSSHNFKDSERPSSTKTDVLISTKTSDMTRRTMFDRSFFFIAATTMTTLVCLGGPSALPAQAKYGASSTMELPNYIEFLMEKNAQADSSQVLYKGADPIVLLQRLQEASKRLEEIPILASQKKWTQVQGLLTGPLGTLSQTLNQIATPDSSKEVQAASKKVKTDLIDISQAASKKNEERVLEKAGQAVKDLIYLLEVAFE